MEGSMPFKWRPNSQLLLRDYSTSKVKVWPHCRLFFFIFWVDLGLVCVFLQLGYNMVFFGRLCSRVVPMTSTTGVPSTERALFHVYVWSSVLEFSGQAWGQRSIWLATSVWFVTVSILPSERVAANTEHLFIPSYMMPCVLNPRMLVVGMARHFSLLSDCTYRSSSRGSLDCGWRLSSGRSTRCSSLDRSRMDRLTLPSSQ